MSKVIVVDGGPRKKWNTAQLLDQAAQDAQEAGAEVERFRLFDLDVKDCYACMACKRVDNKTNGLCAMRDDLRTVLEACYNADGIIVGTPIYYSNLTAQTCAFLCRLMFPLMHYQNDGFHPIERNKHFGLIMTMNAAEENLDKIGYRARYDAYAHGIGTFLGEGETLYCCNTLQFDDYSKYYAGLFDEEAKKAHHAEQFPKDLQAAHNMGARAATGAGK